MTPANLLIYKGRRKKNELNIIYIMRTYAQEWKMQEEQKTVDTEGVMSLYCRTYTVNTNGRTPNTLSKKPRVSKAYTVNIVQSLQYTQ